jgi:ribosomal protein S18 acetylase RimI-like enzyme
VIGREAVEGDVGEILDTLVAAFDDDPVWGGWGFPDRSRAREQRRAMFDLWLRGALPFRSVRVTPDCGAVAVWYAPAGTRSSDDDQRELTSRAHARLGSHAEVFLAGCALLEAAHPQHEPHFYLSLIGTRGSHRGRGLGMDLLREKLAALDAAGMPAYLESTNPANRARYENLGFGRIGEVELPGGGPLVELMWRAPRPNHTS